LFAGMGASRVRSLFNNARNNAPCVIFIDEIDAIGRQRGTNIGGANDEREQTLNEILTNMDGFKENYGVIVIAATNRFDILDSALTRPGRFDRKILVPLPDFDGRKQIAIIHFRNKNVNIDIDYDELSSLTGGFSGADIANLANEAAICSVRQNKTSLDRESILQAYEKITIGLPKAKENRDKESIKLVAYHEGGHTLVAMFFKDIFDVRRVTINANNGGAGGYTLFTPNESYSQFPSKRFMLANIMISLGGRVAEVLLYKKETHKRYNYDDNIIFDGVDDLDITVGASNDLQQANKLARKYIGELGLGQHIGVYDTDSSGRS
jgi:cell division protease FtsH